MEGDGGGEKKKKKKKKKEKVNFKKSISNSHFLPDDDGDIGSNLDAFVQIRIAFGHLEASANWSAAFPQPLEKKQIEFDLCEKFYFSFFFRFYF